MKKFVIPAREVTLYEYSELEQKYKDKVYSEWLNDGHGEYFGFDEEYKCLEEVLGYLGYKIKSYSVSAWNRNYVTLSMENLYL